MKKFLCIFLSAVMLLSCTVIASAEGTALEIIGQPTVNDPTVTVNDETAVKSYQWQSLGAFAEGEITDANASTLTMDYIIELSGGTPISATATTLSAKSSYDNELGWSPTSIELYYASEAYSTYHYFFFNAYFEADSVVEIQLSYAPTSLQDILLMNTSTGIGSSMSLSDDGTSAFCMAPESGFYMVGVITSAAEDIYVKGYGSAVAPFEDIEGENASTLSTVEAGNTYRCAVTASDDSLLYSDAFAAEYEILSRPTAADPTFEVTFEEDASFQWYTLEPETVIFDDTMTAPDYYVAGTYDAETQSWTPSYGEPYDYSGYQEYCVELFYVELEKGESVKVTISNPDAISPEDPDFRFSGENTETEYLPFENGVVEFTAPETDVYHLYHYGIYPETATYKIEKTSYTYIELEGETEKTLKNCKLDKRYAVIASYADGTELADILIMEYAITKQPTADDSTVEVNFGEDVASYAWYMQTYAEIPVTDENATLSTYSSSETIGYYDSENDLWVPSLYQSHTDDNGVEYYEYDLFHLWLNEGDILYITPSAELISGTFETWENFTGVSYNDLWVYNDGVYSFVAPADGEYWFYTYTYDIDITFEASVKGYAFIETVEGETSKTLANPAAGETYMAVVTFDDGTVLKSDEFCMPEPEYLVGDVNADGAIDQYDYVIVKRAYFNTYTLDEDQENRADVDYSGTVDQYDYVLIKRAYFGTYTIEQR